MSILGSYIDSRLASIPGRGLASAALELGTMNHSLPATNPEVVEVHLVSLEDVSAAGVGVHPIVFSPGGNASLLTTGIVYGNASSASIGTVLVRIVARVYHTVVR